MSSKKHHKDLTPDEARRALYIDFEGQKVGPPVVLGCTRRSRIRSELSVLHFVTDPRFAPIARDNEVESLLLADAVERILQRAEKKHRRIVAWSERELAVVREYCSKEQFERFESRYVNARSFAERWRNKVHGGQKPATNELADYLAMIGYEVPEAAGPGQVGKTIAIVGAALDKGKGWPDLTENQRTRWANLMEHNRHDCVGMRRVCVLAADEIAAAE